MSAGPDDRGFDLSPLDRCFGGGVPAVMTTVAVDGTPNVTYLSRAHRVDEERIALSNQFMSKTSRNLASNPAANLLLLDPTTMAEYRLRLRYERTERRGPVFERLRDDVDAIAAHTHMEDVFRLRAAAVFRVVSVERTNDLGLFDADPRPADRDGRELGAMAELATRLGRSDDLDVVVDTVLDGLVGLFGFAHIHLLLLDESGRTLFTIASRGFDAESIGSEVQLGAGLVGMVASRGRSARIGDLNQMAKYTERVRQEFAAEGVESERAVPMPGLPGAKSRIAVPAMALGQVVGVLVADRLESVAFTETDEQVLGVVASMLASAIEHARSVVVEDDAPPIRAAPVTTAPPTDPRESPTVVRYFVADGSVFLDAGYLIKGVAGRILWKLLREHIDTGRVDFTNRELRLDPALELPEVKDNLESRLVLLKRRLDEREAPIRMERTGRGLFRLHVSTPLRIEMRDA